MYQTASNLAFFILTKTGTVTGTWKGRMSAAEQRALFGKFLGKGKLTIDAAEETIKHQISICYGLDYETTACLAWRDL